MVNGIGALMTPDVPLVDLSDNISILECTNIRINPNEEIPQTSLKTKEHDENHHE
jgi:hypothetical protein